MKYVYPKFSSYEIPGLRIGGAGLGNLLFIWSRACVEAKKNNAKLLWPTWPSLKVGPWIRREKDKRFYGDVFCNNNKHIGGLRKYWILSTHRRVKNFADGDGVLLYSDMIMKFQELLAYRELLQELITVNLKKKGQKALQFDAKKAINVHVRLGDFAVDTKGLSEGKNNVRIELPWYCHVVQRIRDVVGEVPVNVFSDGYDEQLADLLAMPNVKRVTFGNSIGDIVALSKSPVMIASGSSFSMWARFLGNSSSVSYPMQMKEAVASGNDVFEVELAENEDFSEEIKEKLKKMYL